MGVKIVYMYAKLCNIEVLPSYVKEVEIGDILTVQALIANALDWHHFYEKVSTIKIGDRTDFTVITPEGERVTGFGNILVVDRWSNHGQYGFKIKVNVKRQKSLSDRRIRGSSKVKLSSVQPDNMLDAADSTVSIMTAPASSLAAATGTTIFSIATAQDINSSQEVGKESTATDIAY